MEKALGPIEFGADQSKYYRESVEAPWFAHWLKDKGALNQPEVLAFEPARNTWEHYDSWPPKTGTEMRKLYTSASRQLSFDAHAIFWMAFDGYISDPAHPVPYRHRPMTRHL